MLSNPINIVTKMKTNIVKFHSVSGRVNKTKCHGGVASLTAREETLLGT